MYTDDGNGGGHLTSPGMHEMTDVSDELAGFRAGPQQPWLLQLGVSFAGAGMSVIMADRREMSEMYNRLIDEMELDRRRPMWEWDESIIDKHLQALSSSPIEKVRYMPILLLLPAVDSAFVAAERATQERDAATVAIALELYRRRHGDWPGRLEELVPELLPAVPPDRFDGEPLKYRVVDGQPVVYSIGADRVDDGGVPPKTIKACPRPHGAADWVALNQAEAIRKNPTQRGDWVLWPPVQDDS